MTGAKCDRLLLSRAVDGATLLVHSRYASLVEGARALHTDRQSQTAEFTCGRRVLAAFVLWLTCCSVGGLPAAADTEAAQGQSGRATADGEKPSEPAEQAAKSTEDAEGKPGEMTLETFLDRLMMAESGGRDHARNPRSTAVGPFQFIRETFLDVVNRHFPEETAKLAPPAILALRTDRAFARRAAAAYSRDNAAHLAGEGLPATFPNLRLAFLAGPAGAVRLLSAPPAAKVSALLSRAAIAANPFMARMTAGDLIAKCARDLEVDPRSTAGLAPDDAAPKAKPSRPRIAVRCNLKLASCRRWLALREAKLRRQEARAGR